MNAAVARELFSQAVIVLGVCIGVWTLFVEPKASAIVALEAEIASGQARLDSANFERLNQIAAKTPEIRTRAREINARSRVARDSAGLYGRIMALAQQQAITVRTLQPRVLVGRDIDTVHLTSIDMTIEGGYERLASFIESLGTVEAYLRISSLSITPIDRENELVATMHVGCEALSFVISPEIVELQGIEP